MEITMGIEDISCEAAECDGCNWVHRKDNGKTWIVFRQGWRVPRWFAFWAMRHHHEKVHS